MNKYVHKWWRFTLLTAPDYLSPLLTYAGPHLNISLYLPDFRRLRRS